MPMNHCLEHTISLLTDVPTSGVRGARLLVSEIIGVSSFFVEKRTDTNNLTLKLELIRKKWQQDKVP